MTTQSLLRVDPQPSASSQIAAAVNAAQPPRDLWREYLETGAATKAARDKYNEAQARMPDWARPGPRYLRSDGSLDGPQSGWPAMPDIAPPQSETASRDVRPGLVDFKRNYDLYANTWLCGDNPKTKSTRAHVRAQYRDRVRKWISRVREQRAEAAKVGIPDLSAKWDVASDRHYAADRAIANQRGTDATIIVGRLLLLAVCEGHRDRTLAAEVETPIIEIFEDFRSALTGTLALLVDEFLAAYHDEKATFGELSFWS